MKRISIAGVFILLFYHGIFAQNIYQIDIKKLPPKDNDICISSHQDCGKLIFITFISGMKFISENNNIKEQKVIKEVTPEGYEKFTYQVVTLALPTQQVTLKGPNLTDYDLTISDLLPATCQQFFINYVVDGAPESTLGSIGLVTFPTGATIKLNDEPQVGNVTPCTLSDKGAGSYRVRLEKQGYQPFDTTVIVVPNRLTNITVTLNPVRGEAISGQPDSIRILETKLKKHGKNQAIWLTSTLISGAAGAFFLYEADKTYKDYQNSTDSHATELRKQFELFDKLGPVFFGLAGICAIEYTIQTVKKSKCRLQLQLGPMGTKITYRF